MMRTTNTKNKLLTGYWLEGEVHDTGRKTIIHAPLYFLFKRVSYNGNTSAFQADAVGSIPTTRSITLDIHPNLWYNYIMISYGYDSHRQMLNPERERKCPMANIPSKDTRALGAVTPPRKSYTTNHTIAPAYNKGPYQVISTTNIKDIGK